MAEVVNSLFGITPESLQAQRNAALDKQAMEYAQLDPLQRASANLYAGANRLGGGIAGLMGVQDPELMRVQQRQGMLQNLDLTDPEALKQGIQVAMQNKDYQLVSELTNRYEKRIAADLSARKVESEITKNLREKAGADPLQQLLRTGKYTIPSISKYEQSGNISDLVPVDPNEPTALSETKEGIFLVSKKDGTKIARIGDAPQRAANINFSPEIKMTDKELDWRKQFLSENKAVIDQAANVRQSIGLLDQGTPFASAAFTNTVVSSLGGDKQKSKAEIDRLANTGALDTRIANTLKNFFEGTQTATTVEDQRVVLNALDNALKARYTAAAGSWSKRLNQAKVDSTLVVPEYDEVVGGKGAAGGTVSYKGAPAKIISQNPDGSVVIEQNGVRKTLAPKKQ